MKFGLITYILHHKYKGSFYSYEPYVREMNIWLKYTTSFLLLAPKRDNTPEPIEKSYFKSPSEFYEIPQTSIKSLKEFLKSILYFPLITIKILKVMKNADHIHLRCPGNVGLIACFVQIFFPHKTKSVKYAGNWDPQALQPWSYKLQKWILSNTFLTRDMTVLVYGQWPDQSRNILPFFTASFSENEKEKIQKDFNSPYKFLFVGNLVPGKQPQFAIRLVEALNEKKIPAELHIYGDGVLKDELEIQAENKDYIHLHGNQPLEVLKRAYKESHFLILASKSEGWPKAVAEAMFFGCIPVVTEVSCVPWMVNYGSRGILIPEVKVKSGEWKEDRQDGLGKVVRGQRTVVRGGVLDETVDRIIQLIKEPEEMKRMSMEAQEWSQQYTLERFEEEIRKLLVPQDARP